MPLYRYFNEEAGDHFYTNNWSHLGAGKNGWRYEGITGYTFPEATSDARPSMDHKDGNLIEAPMPGMVKAVFAVAGQTVQAGDRLAVLEAMKMEHALLAARDGVVAEVLVTAGTQVEAGAALVRLEATEEAAG